VAEVKPHNNIVAVIVILFKEVSKFRKFMKVKRKMYGIIYTE